MVSLVVAAVGAPRSRIGSEPALAAHCDRSVVFALAAVWPRLAPDTLSTVAIAV